MSYPLGAGASSGGPEGRSCEFFCNTTMHIYKKYLPSLSYKYIWKVMLKYKKNNFRYYFKRRKVWGVKIYFWSWWWVALCGELSWTSNKVVRRVFAQQSPHQDKKKTSQKLLFSRGFASFQLHLYSHVAWGTSLQPLSCLPAFPTSWFLFCILLPRPRRALFYTISNYAYLLGFSIAAVQKRGNFSLEN